MNRARLIAILLLFLAGAIQALISPPLNWWWLHPVALAPGFWVLARLSGSRAFLGGLWMGFAANSAIFYWIVHTVQTFSNIPTPGAIAVLALFSAAFGAYLGVFGLLFGPVRRAAGPHWPLAVAALFVSAEFLNPQLFPYYQGVAWYQLPRVFLATAVAGVPFITFQVVLCNLLLVAAWEHREATGKLGLPREMRASAYVFVALLLVSVAYSHARLGQIAEAEATAEEITVGLIQTNDDVSDRSALERLSRDAVAKAHIALSREALQASPKLDVVVFPEGALRRPPTAPENRVVPEFVRETGVEVWGGATDVRPGEGRRPYVYNAAWRVRTDGETDEPYDKTILLPFGEFMPLADTFPVLRKIEGVGNFRPGTGMKTFRGAKDTRFCFLICYEAIRHEYVRDAIQEGVDLLVNITYDAWFGDTSCLTQHLMLSAIQAAEYGVPLVRAATTGISAVTDARGMIVAQTEPFTRAALVYSVKKVNVPSLYGAWGDWFAWLCVGATALLMGARAFWARRAGGSPG